MAMSLICGFSRCTAISRLRSSASFTASSSVSCDDGPRGGCGRRRLAVAASLVGVCGARPNLGGLLASVPECALPMPPAAAPAPTRVRRQRRERRGEHPDQSVPCHHRVSSSTLIALARLRSGAPASTCRVRSSNLRQLLRRQHLVHVQQHQRPHLVECGARRFDLVDLPDDSASSAFASIMLDSSASCLSSSSLPCRSCGAWTERRCRCGRLIGGQADLFLELIGLPPGERLCADRARPVPVRTVWQAPADPSPASCVKPLKQLKERLLSGIRRGRCCI